ncbi:unnamed protein product, partial [Owenia fusiformis]
LVHINGKCQSLIGATCIPGTVPDECSYYDEFTSCHVHRKTCQCVPHYYLSGDYCMPVVGSECENNESCVAQVENSFCNDKDICECQDGFTEHHGFCEQLTNVHGFDCFDRPWLCEEFDRKSACIDGACSCINGFDVNENDVCVSVLGRSCSDFTDCIVYDPNSDCIDGTCLCRAGY